MASPIWNVRGAWFADTPDGVSGLWSCRAAAEAARKGNFQRAWLLHQEGEKK